MANQNSEQEPSIEEILSSIRQIISDDDSEAVKDEPVAAPSPPPPPPEPSPAPVAATPPPPPASKSFEEEVIDLTDKIEDVPVDFRTAEPEPDMNIDMMDEPDIVPEPIPDYSAPIDPPAYRSASAPSALDEDHLLTRSAEQAALSAFSDLARKTAIEHSGITIEEIVRTELRPLLRDWLDRHLPPIIERLVGEELDRVAKRALEQ